MTGNQAIVTLLQIQANHAVRSYNRQIVEQMFAYYDESDDSLYLMSIL